MKKQKAVVTPLPSVLSSPRYDAGRESENNVIGRRIAEARRRRGMTLAAFSACLENYGVHVKTAGVGKWETGDSVPNAYQLLAICSALGMDCDLGCLMGDYEPELNDEGLRVLDQHRRDLICSGNYRPAPRVPHVVTYVDVRVARLPAAAGTGTDLYDDDYYDIVSFPEDQVKPRADVCIRVAGDSMTPDYENDSLVWVQKCEVLQPGEVGIFIYDGKAYIKRYEEHPPEEEFLAEFTDSYGTVHSQPVLVSYNKKYDDIKVNPYIPFKIFGRVLK